MFAPYEIDEERNERLRTLLEVLGTSAVPTSALKAKREASGMSQHELARASGISQPVISRVEAGTTTLTAEAARRLDEALGTDARVGELPLKDAELLSSLKRRALAGELDAAKLESAALAMAATEPSDMRMRPAVDAAVRAMLDVAEVAEKTWQEPTAAKTRNGVGQRREKTNAPRRY